MDSEKLFNSIPAPQRWRGLSDVTKKEFTENFIRTIIDSIDKDGREPDAWEARDIWAAIGALASKMYTASLVYAKASLMAPNQRVSLGEAYLTEPPTATQLLGALDYVTVKRVFDKNGTMARFGAVRRSQSR